MAAKSPFAADIHFTGFVSDADLLDLYACADVLAFPSLYEGFGLPVLEAMACGVPVACADSSSLPEVAGDAASYFTATDSESITAAIMQLLDDPGYRQRCVDLGLERSRRFTWKATAEKTYEVLRSVSLAC
jgi:glycosyltransferase involved in cell wall biosynthesis